MGHRRHNQMPPLALPPAAINQNQDFLNAPLPDGPPLVHYGNDEEEQQPQQPQQPQQQQEQPGYMKPTVSSLNKIRTKTKRQGGKKKKRKTRKKKRKSRRKTRKKRRRKSRKKRKTRRRKKGGMPGRTLPKKLKKSPRVLNLQEMAKKTTDGVWKKFKPKGSTLLKRQPSQGLVEQSLEDELASMTISDSSNTGSNQ